MDMKKGHAEEHENDERWLITYADLITLLMVFFVVMYAMSRTDLEKFKALASGLSFQFGKPATSSVGVGGQPVSGNSILPNKADGDARRGTRNKGADGDVRARRIKALKNDLDSLMEKRGLSKSVATKVDPKGPKLIMELSDSLLFDPGSADLTPQARELLKPVAEVLGARDYSIHVEGHTDNVPISGRYRNNFELSTARAVNVIMAMTESAGLPANMFSASGYGEYRPVTTNDTPEGRAKNRRVDFVIYDENALEAMLGSSMSDGEEAEVAALEGGTSVDRDGAPEAAHDEGAVTAPDPHDTPTGAHDGLADQPASNDNAVAPTEPMTAPVQADENAPLAAPAHAGPEHMEPAAELHDVAPTEPTHAPTLDTPVSTRAEPAETASHSLSSILALPPVKSSGDH